MARAGSPERATTTNRGRERAEVHPAGEFCSTRDEGRPRDRMTAEGRDATSEWDRDGEPSNKRMKLTKLSAAPWLVWRRRLMPAPARSDAGTASQLIRSVGRTWAGCVADGVRR